MRVPTGLVDNPDVVDRRGVPALPESSGDVPWDGVSPLVYRADADRRLRDMSLLLGGIAVGAFFIGHSLGRTGPRPARPPGLSSSRARVRDRR
jgi:hypothetical protein